MTYKVRTYHVFAVTADAARIRGLEFAVEDGLRFLDASTRRAPKGAGFDYYVFVRLLPEPGRTTR
jgi:hypothetical protein